MYNDAYECLLVMDAYDSMRINVWEYSKYIISSDN